MKILQVDFNKSNDQKSNLAGLLTLLTGVIVAILIAELHNEIISEQNQIQAAQARQQDSGARKERSDSQNYTAGFSRAASVIAQLSFPWDDLFQTIEKNTGKDVALLGIQPNMESKTVALDAESKDWNTMLEYIKRLEVSGFFSDVHLSSHQILSPGSHRSVRFRLKCIWHSPDSILVNSQ